MAIIDGVAAEAVVPTAVVAVAPTELTAVIPTEVVAAWCCRNAPMKSFTTHASATASATT